MGREIAGRARDTRGAPLAGARVMFKQAPVSVPDVALLTDGAGAFRLAAPAPGRYVVACFADGFAPGEATVTLADAPANVEFVLAPER